jgi:hypothetical protein
MSSRALYVLFGTCVTILFVILATMSTQCPCDAGPIHTEAEDVPSETVPRVDTVTRVLFLHHSTGNRWLARNGRHEARDEVLLSSPNGGDLRDRMESAGFEVHQATYGSRLGERTDVFDWPVKFRLHMDELLRCDHQDRAYEDARRNHVVVFKSCFPNNLFMGPGRPPGSAEGPILDVANAQAAYRALLPEFARTPHVLFVAVTAPPLACVREARWRALAKRLLGRADLTASGAHARVFNRWLADRERGWLAEYREENVVVFDLYDVLTGNGASDFALFPTGPRGEDSHPSAAGLSRATARFVPFLVRAVGQWRQSRPTSTH